jgi:hypothetical protein
MADNKKQAMSKPSTGQATAPTATISVAERNAIIDRIAGFLTSAEADELARIIEECCEQIDEHG